MSVYLDAISLKNVSRPPIWMMRQAGRYLPEYRKLRKKYSFLEMIKTPDLATEITLQPIKRFGFDAAILFSDILTVAESLGSELEFTEKIGPVINNPISTLKDIQSLNSTPISLYSSFVYQAINQIKKSLPFHIPLIGFSGAPFTVASYMIEGGSSQHLKKTKTLIGTHPKVVHVLLEKLTNETIQYLVDQINAGVDSIQIFDTWAGHLNFNDFEKFALSYINTIVTTIKNKYPKIPITIFSKHSTTFSPLICSLPINCISLDWQTSLQWAINNIPKNVAIQGNLDPATLLGKSDTIKNSVNQILSTMKNRPGYIFNLGHGITPDVPIDNVSMVVELVKQFDNSK